MAASQFAFTETVLFEAHCVMVGGFAATTVTVKLHVAPWSEVHCTIVEPAANVEPEGGLHVTPLQVPLVVGAEYVTTALHCPALALCVMSPGQVSEHPPLLALLTVTLKVQDCVLLNASVAVHVTAVVPTENTEPEGGVHEVVTQLPVVVGAG